MAPSMRLMNERVKRRKSVSSLNLAMVTASPLSWNSCGIMPSIENDPGDYQFSVLLGGLATTKNKWTYCHELCKLYIVWHQVIPIEFNWIHSSKEKLFVRALPIFTDPQYRHQPVERCFIHLDSADPTNEDIRCIRHVLRSENPGAMYEEHVESKRCSVLVPLEDPQPGTGSVTITYKFMCKTSCVTGKTRRNMAVVFTLERNNGEVLGRQLMHVKVCSCPRRDMEKEEQTLRRKIKKESTDDEPMPQQSFKIVIPHVEMFNKVLEFNHGAVSSLLRTTPANDPRYTELNDFLTVLEEKLSHFSQCKN